MVVKPTEVRCAFKQCKKRRIHYMLMFQGFFPPKRDQGLRAVSSWRRKWAKEKDVLDLAY